MISKKISLMSICQLLVFSSLSHEVCQQSVFMLLHAQKKKKKRERESMGGA